MLNALLSTAARFRRDMRGNVAIIFAAAAVPLFGLVGGAVDYTQHGRDRAQFQAAYDAASIAAARQLKNGVAAVNAEAERVLRANLGAKFKPGQHRVEILDNNSTVQIVSNGASTSTVFLGLYGYNTLAINVTSASTFGAQALELALVLDTTGSMSNDMPALRSAASKLARDVMAISPDSRVAVVPFVAAVNPGRAALPLSMVDVSGQSRHHAELLKTRQIGRDRNCVWPWDRNPQPPSGGGGGGGGGGPQPPPDTGGGSDRTDFWSTMRSIAGVIQGVFGVSSAHAVGAEVTPSTRAPYSGVTVRPGVLVPDGFLNWNECGLNNPERISNLDLFARIPNARWKGCVEARPAPFDVTDEAPRAGNPDTLFVPYFYPDEISPQNNGVTDYGPSDKGNNYLPDGFLRSAGNRNQATGPLGWSFDGDWDRTFNLFKYDGVTNAAIEERGPNPRGPNAFCPDEILPLTNDASAVQNRINSLSHWAGGGTMSSEGVMWGWRVLSPGPPFTEGRPYGEASKVMVLMSDGMNTFQRGNDDAMKSDYSAYGALRFNSRLGSDRFDDSSRFLNERMATACENAKREGITIYAVMFRERDPEARRVMRGCSTNGQLYYEAANAADLNRAFTDIADSIQRLRIKR